MIKFKRETKDKTFTKEQDNVFHSDENGLVCHMLFGEMSFDNIVCAVRNYYQQYPDSVLDWDVIVESNNVEKLVLESEKYIRANEIVALALIRLVENDFVSIIKND